MVNKAILIGNLGHDPSVRTLDGGTKTASFTLATSETYKNKNGEKVINTEWHNVVVWRSLAEIVEKYVKKGDKIYIEGKITHRKYTAKDGAEKYITEIVADTMTMLGGKKDGQQSESQGAPEPARPAADNLPNEPEDPWAEPKAESDGDLPF